MSKYRSRKAVVNGKTFDSIKEAKRFCELSLLEKSGEIANFQCQKVYELIPAQYETFPRFGKNGRRLKDGKKLLERAVTYKADFVYFDRSTGAEVVEDTKGVRTTEYILKRKMMLFFHGIKIREL